MNLLLLKHHQLRSANLAQLSDRQYLHIKNVLKLNSGDQIRLGLMNSNIGVGSLQLKDGSAFVEIEHLQTAPPPPLPLTLLLALPRPQMIKRILQTAACMGVAHLCFFQSSRVEKSFWQSPTLNDDAIEQQLLLGLEQGMATQIPKVSKFLRFHPFIEEHLEELSNNKRKLIAHPGPFAACPELAVNQASMVAIGPEGGFLDKEVNAFQERGFEAFQMGSRILKVETAVTALTARLYSLP